MKLSYPELVLLDLRHSAKASISCPELIVTRKQRNYMNAAARIKLRTAHSPPKCVYCHRDDPIESFGNINDIRLIESRQGQILPESAQNDKSINTPSYNVPGMLPIPRGMWLLGSQIACLAQLREQNYRYALGSTHNQYQVQQLMRTDSPCTRLYLRLSHHPLASPSENVGSARYPSNYKAASTYIPSQSFPGRRPTNVGEKDWPSIRSTSTGSSCDIEIHI